MENFIVNCEKRQKQTNTATNAQSRLKSTRGGLTIRAKHIAWANMLEQDFDERN